MTDLEPTAGHAYRAMPDVLGLEEREGEAVRAYGQWRDRVRTLVLAAFAIVGAVGGMLAYLAAMELQLEHLRRASLVINAAAAASVFVIAMVIGVVVGRALVRQRTARKLDALATAYEVPRANLESTASLVRGL